MPASSSHWSLSQMKGEDKVRDGRPTRGPTAMTVIRLLFAHRGSGRFVLRFHGIKIEARALLHRWELDRGLGQLLHLLLDKHEPPELVLKPREVILRPGFGPIFGPAGALERIDTKVGQIRHVSFGFITQPAAGLVDETILEVVDAHGAELAFAEVPDFVPLRRPLAGDHVHLIVAVEMTLVGAVPDLLALLQLFGDVRISGGGQES